MKMKTDADVPGGIYLCQIKENVSCAACCGLYNVSDASRDALINMLNHRTNMFARTPRTMDAILAFKEETEARENQERPYPKFHHCAYIGWIGKAHSRTGCLLHPLAQGNNNVDFRGLSFYGGMACNGYFCPSYRKLSKVYKEILREISDDWYLYGLIITETTLVNAFFYEVELRLNTPLKKEDILDNPMSIRILRKFLNLKLTWEFRSQDAPLGNYFFDDALYAKKPINYRIGMRTSRYNTLFQELSIVFESSDTIHHAESSIEQLIESLVCEIRRYRLNKQIRVSH